MSPQVATQNASPPFNGPDGDVIIQTSDDVAFHVYKVILSLASAIFKDMFDMKQPDCAADTKHTVKVTEGAAALDAILRWCYPIPAPVIEDIAAFGPVLRAAAKYAMDEVSHRARKAFRELISHDPLYAYALSCKLDFEEDAAIAASIWRRQNLSRCHSQSETNFALTTAGISFSPDIGTISAGSYFRLLAFMRTPTMRRFCSPSDGDHSADNLNPVDEAKLDAAYPFTLPDTDLVVRSYDNANFRVHKLIIALHVDPNATNATHSLLASSDTAPDGATVTMVKADCHTLAELLSLCYPPFPGTSTMISDWSSQKYCDSVKVIQAAQDHGLSSIVRSYRSQFKNHLEDKPLDLYCIAVSLGWPEEARLAAETLATDTVEEIGYSPLLESIPANDYYRLLKFCFNYRHAVMSRMGSATYQGWTDVTQWKEEWFTLVAQRSTRTIPSILVEREVAAARGPGYRLQYATGGKFNLKDLVELGQEMEQNIKNAVSQIEL